MHPIINIAVAAARQAGRFIQSASEKLDTLTVENKNFNEYVSQVDRKSEEIIKDAIKKAHPEHAIMGEETGETPGDDTTWIIDPLDGTTNFVHGYPQYAISIAVRVKQRVEYAVIYDPTRDDLFTAVRGGGARWNDRRIRVSTQRSIERALIGTGFPYRNQEQLDFYLDCFKSIFPQTAGIRRAGSAALDLAYVAAGKLDGFWEIGLKEWDFAAGVLLIKEAGGLVSDFEGSENYKSNGNIIAGNPKVFKDLLRQINPHLAKLNEKV